MIFYENLALLNQTFWKDYQEKFNQKLQEGWFILGNSVESFESEFASYCESQYCIGVSSGLDALLLALKSFDFPKNSEVIVPANTFIATILAVVLADLKPILVEPDIHSYNIDYQLIESKISSQTVAIIPVHLSGRPCEMDKIIALAQKYSLRIIEDAAQAHGAKFKNKKIGGFGDVTVFSFYPTKNLGALGDAGGITTNDKNLAEKIKTLRNYGSSQKYHNEIIGYNARLDEIQADFLSIKLKRLDEINTHKRKLADLYFKNLKPDFILPLNDENTDYYQVYHIFNIRHEKRDILKDYLRKHQIQTEIHYPIVPTQQIAYKEILAGQITPIAEKIHATTLSLPISFAHKPIDIEKVIEILNKF